MVPVASVGEGKRTCVLPIPTDDTAQSVLFRRGDETSAGRGGAEHARTAITRASASPPRAGVTPRSAAAASGTSGRLPMCAGCGPRLRTARSGPPRAPAHQLQQPLPPSPATSRQSWSCASLPRARVPAAASARAPAGEPWPCHRAPRATAGAAQELATGIGRLLAYCRLSPQQGEGRWR